MSNGLINRQYVGARYVPKIMGEWNKALQYEALSIVTYMGNSFTSKVPVPTNIEIDNTDYWINTGNYNTQVENYRKETEKISMKLNTKINFYNNVNEMINDNYLKNGDYVKTKGYHVENDDGESFYNISETKSDIYITLNNGLYANLEINDSTIRPEQLGAYGDNIHDDTEAIQRCINYSSNLKLFILFNNKQYKTTEPLILKNYCCLNGGLSNDEYMKKSIISNNVTNIFTLESDVLGVKINNMCLSGNKIDNYVINSNYSLLWSEINNTGIVNFNIALNLKTLGCRLSKLWFNHLNSIGTISGSDNIFTDWFGSGALDSYNKYDFLTLQGFTLSRLYNLFLTGKTKESNGCRDILVITGYSSNVSINGCYFDYSNGCGINIKGAGNDFPKSGVTGININNCLFRGNGCDLTNKSSNIKTEYCRNVTINGCSFKTQTQYSENENNKIYSFNDYSQGILLQNNYYEKAYSIEGTSANVITALECYPKKQINIGVTTNAKNIYANTYTETTDSTYGSITIYFSGNFTTVPMASFTVTNKQAVAYVSEITKDKAVLLIKNFKGDPVFNASITVNAILCEI